MKQKQYGQAVILVALMMVVLVACVGLALDGANIFLQQREVNNVADAAALAGTRAFLEQKRQGASDLAVNNAVYSAASSYILAALTKDQITFKISYFLNNGNPSNRYYQLKGANDSSNLPSQKKNNELIIRGVEVEIHYTFRTFFMQILYFDTSTVQSKGLGYFGYLGSAVGEDIIPLAIDMSAGNMLRGTGTFRIQAFNDNPSEITTPDVFPIELAMISFIPNENVSANAGCNGNPNSPPYWWCAGSASTIEIGDTMEADSYPFTPSLRGYIQSRIARGKDRVLVPEYFGDPSSGEVTISSFIALRLVDIDKDTLVVEYLPYFSTSGSISGNGNGVPGAYAINLVR